ncbi:uncharacterized protein Dwil_GK18876 [Drosophila willistoni]|uniref:trypsin n=1 Tax=Drosophila willistoni TaxID=7260 RepID=B4N3C9_DROWI|nr:trypsin 3A1 [Drosophila willistoni]EDW78868.1 uncharacterized protein Dwil_GK18876 [Drosophila willistoni]
MLKLFVGLCLLHFLEGSPPHGKIVGGDFASIADYPHLVNLRIKGIYHGGGSLITPTCVLTAAHCIFGQNGFINNVAVHAQQQCLGDPVLEEQVRTVLYASVSPNYKHGIRNYDSDIAILKLTRPFDITGKASLVKLDFNELPANANLTVAGWGSTYHKELQNPNQCLKAAQVHLVPQQECITELGSFSPVTENMFCAIGENATDTCPGDSGGPILFENRLTGIVSWGVGCGLGLPGVYTKLGSPAMTSFVKSVIERHC